MPAPSSSLDTTIYVSAPNVWYLVEEQWYDATAIGERWLTVPYGLIVILRHNYMWPFWLNEGAYPEGSHRLYIPYGYNKFQVSLDQRTPHGGAVVWTIP